MDAPNIYTITIVRNLGTPISFTVKRWKVRFFLIVFLLFSTFVGYEAFLYLRLNEESKELRKTLAESQKKIELLSEQIANYNNALYRDQVKVEESPSTLETTLMEQPEIDEGRKRWGNGRRDRLNA